MTSAVHFGHEIPSLIKNARKGRGPLGRLVYRLHLQKYLSEGSAQLTKQLTKVLKPATAFSVGAAAVSTLVTIGAIAVLTFFSMLEAPRLWQGVPGPVPPVTALRMNRVVNESIRSVTGYMLGNFLTSLIAGVVVGVTLAILGVPFALLLGAFVALVDLLPAGGRPPGRGPRGGHRRHPLGPGRHRDARRLPGLPAGGEPRAQPDHHEQDGPPQPVLGPAGRPGRRHPGGQGRPPGLGTFVGALIGIPVGGALQVVVREIRRGPLRRPRRRADVGLPAEPHDTG